MSFPIILLIMLACGVLGGIINYILPANENSDNGKKIKPAWQCILLGIGATLLVPLFLQIAQSKLLDKVYFSFSWQQPVDSVKKQPVADTVQVMIIVDSAKKESRHDTTLNKKRSEPTASGQDQSGNGRDYLVYAAYCLLAAAAGLRFINMLISNVVKDQVISKQQAQITDLKKVKIKRELNSQESQRQEEEQIRRKILTGYRAEANKNILEEPSSVAKRPAIAWPVLPAISNPDDPQKNRFGGSAKRNGRSLKAGISISAIPSFYDLTLWVESDDPTHNPLNSDVVFFLHDSFSPSVILVSAEEIKEGRATVAGITTYGAFTVGVITDDGNTVLELDLSEDANFPSEFKDR